MYARARTWLEAHRTAVACGVGLVVGLGVALWSLWPTFHARFGLIDDHEIANLLGPEHRFRFWDRLLGTEVGAPFHVARYRPSYYSLRLLETKLWGFHPGVWYVSHAAMFGVFLAAVVFALRRVLSLGENVVLALFLVTLPLWGDVFARLGPGEVYTVLGSGLYAVGVALVLDRRDRLGAVLVLLGGFAAVGSKENYVILALPSAILAIVAWRRRAWWLVAANVFVVLYSIAIAVIVAIGVKNVGHVYLEDVSPHGRVEAAKIGLRRAFDGSWRIAAVVLVLLVACIPFARRRATTNALRDVVVKLAITAAGLALLWVWQIVFYNPKWPTGMVQRYGFPGVLVPAFAIYAAAWAIDRAAATAGVPIAVRVVARVAGCAWVLISFWPKQLPLRAAAEHTYADTVGVGARMDFIMATVKQDPSRPIIVDSYNIWDSEPIFAFELYCRYEPIANPVFVRPHYAPAQFGAGSLERRLASEASAKHDGGDFYVRPWRELEPGPCYGVGLAGAPEPGCTSLGVLR